jgi:hypothetical protein
MTDKPTEFQWALARLFVEQQMATAVGNSESCPPNLIAAEMIIQGVAFLQGVPPEKVRAYLISTVSTDADGNLGIDLSKVIPAGAA